MKPDADSPNASEAKPARKSDAKPDAKSAGATKDYLTNRQTSDEARRLLTKFGPNTMTDTSVHPLRMALEKFWAAVPWMLEAAIVRR